MISATAESGCIGGRTVHTHDLTLATDLEDPPWRALGEQDTVYGLFAWVLDVQDDWTEDEHQSFWKGAIELWPHKRGQHRHRDLLAGWVSRWLQLGFEVAEIEGALSYAPGTLHRMGVIGEARRHAAEIADRIARLHDAATFDLLRSAAEEIGFINPDEAAALLYEPERGGRLIRCPRVATSDDVPAWGLRSPDWDWDCLLGEAGQRRRSSTLTLVRFADGVLHTNRNSPESLERSEIGPPNQP